MLEYLNTAPWQLAPRRLAQRLFPLEFFSVVLNEDTGELMEYGKIMPKPKYRQLYLKYYAKEIGRLVWSRA